MVTLLVGFLSLLPVTIVALFFVFAEYLDWHGRIEVLEKKHRKLAHFIKNRPFRLALLLLVFGMLAADWKESLKQRVSEPPRAIRRAEGACY
jgi:hypothetical protein